MINCKAVEFTHDLVGILRNVNKAWKKKTSLTAVYSTAPDEQNHYISSPHPHTNV